MNNTERVESIQQDVDVNYTDLKQIPDIESQIQWLCNYVLKVESFLALIDIDYNKTNEITYMSGYMQSLKDLKQDLEDIK